MQPHGILQNKGRVMSALKFKKSQQNSKSQAKKAGLKVVTPTEAAATDGMDGMDGSLGQKISRSVKKISLWLYVAGLLFIATTTWSSKRSLDSKVLALATFMSTTSADQISNYDLDSLDKSAKYALQDSEIKYVAFIDSKEKILTAAGEKGKLNSEIIKPVQKGDAAALGRVEVHFSNGNVIMSALLYLVLGAVGLFFFQRFIKDQFGEILAAIIEPTRAVVEKLNNASGLITESSSALVATSQNLALEVANQSAATTQSMSAMTEMGEMVARTVEYSRTSVEKVGEVEKKTQEGELVVRKMATSMESIEESTSELKQIYNIVAGISAKASLINEIVFQTKLLSFNASVEAARAGEHGRGFSVVAEEIGHLAVMSGNAAKEINDLLGQSREHVDRIVESTTARISDVRSVSTDTIKVFEEIAREIRDVTSHISQIDQAAREQDAGVRNTQDAMMKIEQISRKSNEIAEGVRSSAEGLSSQSHNINDVIAELKRLV
jgi:methyl-accepting chemotaxis protein